MIHNKGYGFQCDRMAHSLFFVLPNVRLFISSGLSACFQAQIGLEIVLAKGNKGTCIKWLKQAYQRVLKGTV